MARQQQIASNPIKIIAAAATPEPLVNTSNLVLSVLIQALPTNTDFVYFGDATGQNVAISPGKSVRLEGDKLDHGTQAMLDISTVYIRVLVDGEGVAFTYLQGV